MCRPSRPVTGTVLPLPFAIRRINKRSVQHFFYLLRLFCYRGNVFTEPLLSNDKGIHIQTHNWLEGFMKYAVKTVSGAMILWREGGYASQIIRIKMGSTSDDWIYWQFSYTRTLNYTYIKAVHRYSWFTQFTDHRCSRTRISLTPLVVS
jgi:hypothetical protein